MSDSLGSQIQSLRLIVLRDFLGTPRDEQLPLLFATHFPLLYNLSLLLQLSRMDRTHPPPRPWGPPGREVDNDNHNGYVG